MRLVGALKTKFTKINIIFICAGILSLLIIIFIWRATPAPINLATYEQLLAKNEIKSAVTDGDEVILKTKGKNYRILKESIDVMRLNTLVSVEPKSKQTSWFKTFLIALVTAFGALCASVAYFKLKNFRKKPLYTPQIPLKNEQDGEFIATFSSVKFNDVAGLDEVKGELFEVVDFLKNPQKYTKFGVVLPKGFLLSGPPGVGKTLVAKAVAGEAEVPFFYQSGSAFVQIYAGAGAKRVRELFAAAKAVAPAIIFIDEIDAVGKKRGEGRSDERESTLNQLLVEMDGFVESSGIIVIAATNRIETLDEALLRSGRFDRRIRLGLPNSIEREDILRTHLRNKSTNANLAELARKSSGFSGAALATLVNEAALHALRLGKSVIEQNDFDAVSSSVLSGREKSVILTEKEREILALYQASKAVVAASFGLQFEKLTLFEEILPPSERQIVQKSELIARICILLAGRVGVNLFTNSEWVNQHEDLENIRTQAVQFVQKYGFGDSFFVTQAQADLFLQECEERVRKVLKNARENVLQKAQQIASL